MVCEDRMKKVKENVHEMFGTGVTAKILHCEVDEFDEMWLYYMVWICNDNE